MSGVSVAGRRVIYVYDGPGVSLPSLSALLRRLTIWTDPTPYTVQSISPQQLLAGEWRGSAALLAFGGGYDRGFVRALGERGQAVIRDYVEAGGAYLGVCAGGYFGCDYVAFDRDGPLAVCGHRQLKFFHGECVGPAFPGFQYDSEVGSRASRLSWDVSNLPAQTTQLSARTYYNGGGVFSPYEGPPTHQVLARYLDLPGAPPAAVLCHPGSGVALLTGVHFEYGPDDLDPDNEYSRPIIAALRQDEEQRALCVDSVMRHLRLTTDCTARL